MMIGGRNVGTILGAPFQMRHYRAFFGMPGLYGDFMHNLRRYLLASGPYPYSPVLKTLAGKIQPTLFSHHDLLTVNEIFARRDYETFPETKVVVDFGSNIGISALYFLTHSPKSFVYLFEPLPRNIGRLKANLKGFESRYKLYEKAISTEAGIVDFGVEDTGRYGGIGVQTGESLKVEALDINVVLGDILAKEGHIDILKMDVEGLETKLLLAIKPEFLEKIGNIYMEDKLTKPFYPKLFIARQYGTVCQLINKGL
ncbi:MAG: FkbM family methyltransferase [Bacteroidota bacterium]